MDHTRRFPDLAAAVASLPGRTLVLDGEVAIFDRQLRSRFDLRERLRARVEEWIGFLSGEPVVARQILRKLIHDRLTLTPRPETHSYEITGNATYGKLLEGVVVGVVPPGGTEGYYTVEITAIVAAA